MNSTIAEVSLQEEQEEMDESTYPSRVRLSEGFVFGGETFYCPLVIHFGGNHGNILLRREDGQIRSMAFSRPEILRLAEEVMERHHAGLL